MGRSHNNVIHYITVDLLTCLLTYLLTYLLTTSWVNTTCCFCVNVQMWGPVRHGCRAVALTYFPATSRFVAMPLHAAPRKPVSDLQCMWKLLNSRVCMGPLIWGGLVRANNLNTRKSVSGPQISAPFSLSLSLSLSCCLSVCVSRFSSSPRKLP